MSTINWRNLYGKVQRFTLPPDGKLTSELRWVLLNGHCHSFALALNRLTGWKLTGRIMGDMHQDGLEHIYCLKEPCVLVDAQVCQRFEAECFINLHQWYEGRSGFLEVPLTFHFRQSSDWLKPQVEKMIPFAQERLRELEIETEPTMHPIEMPK
ncbi:MAG: hypothetical protein WBM24_17405 [Candidatus Sulfotelmatobacter sp.]